MYIFTGGDGASSGLAHLYGGMSAQTQCVCVSLGNGIVYDEQGVSGNKISHGHSLPFSFMSRSLSLYDVDYVKGFQKEKQICVDMYIPISAVNALRMF